MLRENANKVVARFKKNGTIMKGTTSDFFPNKKEFHLELSNIEIVNIDVEQLKAIFFVKDFAGHKSREDVYNDVVTGGGKKIKVQFTDDELIIGYVLSYSEDRHGFFITPADLQCNNERIFVVKSATEKIEIISPESRCTKYDNHFINALNF